MAFIAWRKEFETGVPDVDHEHKELVALINRLAEEIAAGADKEDVRRFLGEVFARIAAHFALEESIMRKHGYDEYEHETLFDDIRDIMDEAETECGEALSATVSDWFVGHFKTKDARLHKKLGV